MILSNVCGCLCLLFRIAFWMPSMGGGSHVTGPETCGPLLLPNPNLRQDKGCQWAAKIRSLPWLLKCDDFRYRSLMNYFRLKKFARVQTCDGFKLLLKSGITACWLEATFQAVFCLQPSVLCSGSPQIPQFEPTFQILRLKCPMNNTFMYHVYLQFAGQTSIRFGTPQICRPEASFCWCLLSGSHIYFHSSLCLIYLKRLSEISSTEAGEDGIGMVIIGQ